MNLLEQIIRKTLFEGRTIAKIRRSTAKMTSASRKVQAVDGYAVLVKGTANRTAILKNVLSVTIVATSTNSENIGESGPYANGKYMYVCNEPLTNTRQLINVWIVPVSFINNLPDINPKNLNLTKQDQEETLRAQQGFAKIGDSIMLTKTQLSRFKNIDATGFEVLNGEVVDVVEKLSAEEVNKLIKSGYKFSNDEIEDLKKQGLWPIEDKKTVDDKTVDDKTVDDKTVDDTDQTITYPYKWDTNNGEFTVYTAAPTDTYVYWVQNNVWQTFKKLEFETNIKIKDSDITGMIISKPAVIASLNKMFNQNVTATSDKVKPETTIKIKTPAGDSNKNKVIQLNTAKKNAKDKLQYHEIKLNKTDVYEYKNGKFNKIGNYDPKNSQQIRYLGSSSDSKYVQVQFMKDNMKAWIPTSAVK